MKAWFSDATAASGIDFRHDSGARGRHRLPESLGSGCALFDADGDGDLDAYLVSARDLDGGNEIIGDGNRFFRNRGDGTFVDDTAASGLADDGFGCGVATGDVDGDGLLDLYLANLGPDRLFINDGLGRFELADDDRFANDADSPCPLLPRLRPRRDLDLFVSRYMDWSLENEVDCTNLQGDPDYCNPDMYGRAIPDRLLRNDGTGRFEDVTESPASPTPPAGARGRGRRPRRRRPAGPLRRERQVAEPALAEPRGRHLRRGGRPAGMRHRTDGSPRASMSVSCRSRPGRRLRDPREQHPGEADGLFENRDGHFLDRARAGASPRRVEPERDGTDASSTSTWTAISTWSPMRPGPPRRRGPSRRSAARRTRPDLRTDESDAVHLDRRPLAGRSLVEATHGMAGRPRRRRSRRRADALARRRRPGLPPHRSRRHPDRSASTCETSRMPPRSARGSWSPAATTSSTSRSTPPAATRPGEPRPCPRRTDRLDRTPMARRIDLDLGRPVRARGPRQRESEGDHRDRARRRSCPTTHPATTGTYHRRPALSSVG